MTAAAANGVTVSDLVKAIRQGREHPAATVTVWREAPLTGSVQVVGAHPGAGASAVAIATADALAATGLAVSLVDAAPRPDAFGAAEIEVQPLVPGSRAGRRGGVTVLRDVLPRDWPNAPATVIDGDVGSPLTRVVVCRATLPSLALAEQLMRGDSPLAVVGIHRWPKAVRDALGERIRRASDSNRVVFFPHHRDLELLGVDASRTPTALLSAGTLLADLLWPMDREPARPRRQKGSRR